MIVALITACLAGVATWWFTHKTTVGGAVDAFVPAIGTSHSLRGAERLGPGDAVATLLVDSGLKYLSADVYARPVLGDAASGA